MPESGARSVTAATKVLAGTEIPGGGGRGVLCGGGEGGKGRLCLSPHCHHQDDSCIKTGSDESRFKVTLIALLPNRPQWNSSVRECTQFSSRCRQLFTHWVVSP